MIITATVRNLSKQEDTPITSTIEMSHGELTAPELQEVVILHVQDGNIANSIMVPLPLVGALMNRIMQVKEELMPKVILPDSGLVGFKKG